MGKLYGLKQRRAAEYWDTLCQGVGNMNLPTTVIMYSARHTGQKHLSNLDTAGQLPSDNTFVTLALSCTTIFYHQRFAAQTANAVRIVGTSMTPADLQFMAELNTMVRKQLLFIYRVGEKMSYEAFSDAWPAAQGTAGAVAVSSPGASTAEPSEAQGFFNNGTVDYGSLLRLGKPEVIAARQLFQVEARFATLATQNPAPTGGTSGAAADVLTYLNAQPPATGFDFKHISVRMLGVHTRDVQ
jgi:hypothetical protein